MRPAHAPIGARREADIEQQQIVVIDDDQEIRELLSELLTALGFRVTTLDHVDDPEVVVALRPAAVITDLRLTGNDNGMAAIEALRAHAALATTPMLACTGDVFALRRYRGRLKELNVASISRPFGLEDLERRIAQLLGPAGGS